MTTIANTSFFYSKARRGVVLTKEFCMHVLLVFAVFVNASACALLVNKFHRQIAGNSMTDIQVLYRHAIIDTMKSRTIFKCIFISQLLYMQGISTDALFYFTLIMMYYVIYVCPRGYCRYTEQI